MGDHIVQRLGLEKSVDTLGRWMAHRITELIERAGDERAKREATDLILRCWERRRGWTSGWPPGDLGDALKFADRELGREPGREEPTLPWASRLAATRRSLDEEYSVWFSLALAEDPPESPAEDGAWFFDDELDGDEKRVTRLLARLNVQSEAFFEDLGSDATPTQRAELARGEIARLREIRALLFDEAATDDAGEQEGVP